MNFEQTCRLIRERGGRMTKTRRAVLEILFKSGCLVSQSEILAGLKKRKLKPNRSTIFRELAFLLNNKLLVKKTISGVDYYEFFNCHHHQHLICIGCNLIEKIAVNHSLKKQEEKIAKQKHFNIINHNLEFYGYCPKCQA